jgi:predicted RNase H-like HicB family nuclease
MGGSIMVYYRVAVEKGEDFGYVVHCPVIPGCHSQGDTMEEALDNIRDAISACLLALDKELIPDDRRPVTFVEVAI